MKILVHVWVSSLKKKIHFFLPLRVRFDGYKFKIQTQPRSVQTSCFVLVQQLLLKFECFFPFHPNFCMFQESSIFVLNRWYHL